MNDTNPMPPPLPSPTWNPGPLPLGDDLSDRTPIGNPLAAIEAILRHPRRLLYQMRQPGGGRLVAAMVVVAVVCALVYGVVVGTFSGGTQLWAAPAKIAAGLLVSATICLPSLYIFACLGGSQARLIDVGGLLAGLVLLMTILLIGFAPVAWIFSQSTESLAFMGTLHLIFWLVATLFGVRFLKAGFTHANTRSQAGINVWVVIFLLVALQMTTALRPLLGKADTFFPAEKKFFLAHWGDCFSHNDETAKAGTVR